MAPWPQHSDKSHNARRRQKEKSEDMARKPQGIQKYRDLAARRIVLEAKGFDDLSMSSIDKMDRFRMRWGEFCAEVLEGQDPESTLIRDNNIGTFEAFFTWLLDQSTATCITTLITYWNTISQFYWRVTGRRVEKETYRHITNFIRTTLKASYALHDRRPVKDVLDFQDLRSVVVHHWVNSRTVFQAERERVQLAAYLLILAYTGSRPGALIESSARLDTNMALRWRDIELLLWRTTGDINVPYIFVMKVTLAFRKGDERSERPQTFTMYMAASEPMCPLLYILALAFADQAFEAECLMAPADLLRLRVPPEMQSLQLKFRESLLDVPVFRRVKGLGHKLKVDPRLAWNANRAGRHLNTLGVSAGLKTPLTAYCIRRATGNAIDSNASSATRNEVMGHGNNRVFEQHYFSQHIRFDVQATVSGDRPTTAIVEKSVSMGAYADPKAPTELTAAQRAIAWEHSEVIRKSEDFTALSEKLRREYGQISKISKDNPALQQYRDAYKALEKERRFRERLYFVQLRQAYFDSVSVTELTRQLSDLHNEGEKDLSSILANNGSDLQARAQFVDAAFNRDAEGEDSEQNILARRVRCVELLLQLCHQRDGRWITRKCREVNKVFLRKRMEEKGITEEEARHATYAIELPNDPWQKHCMFCYAYEFDHTEDRLKIFTRIDGLRKHVHNVHLSKMTDTDFRQCPLPSCREQLDGRVHFLNHAASAHNFCMAKNYAREFAVSGIRSAKRARKTDIT